MDGKEDIVVAPLVQSLLDKLASDVLENFRTDWKVVNELDNLSETLANIQAMLGCLEMLQTRDLLVKRYLKKLRDLAHHIDAVLQEFISEKNQKRSKRQVYIYFSLNTNQMLRPHEIAHLINELIEKLDQIENKLKPHYSIGSSLLMKGLLKASQLQETTRPKSGSFIDESRAVYNEEDVIVIKSKLLSLDQNTGLQREVPGVIAIVGMEGVGKTTLAQVIYNDLEVEEHFDLRSWVCVSEDFNTESLTGAILESAIGEPCNLKNLEARQRKLQKEVHGKKFLLVLDDVWNVKEASWDVLRAPFRFADEGSRIIITTTPSTSVLSFMNAIHRLDL